MTDRTIALVEIFPTAIWIESGMFGERSVVLQHQGCEPFVYATFGYDYRYTSSGGTLAAAQALARSLGAVDPIEMRSAPFPVARIDPTLRQAQIALRIGTECALTHNPSSNSHDFVFDRFVRLDEGQTDEDWFQTIFGCFHYGHPMVREDAEPGVQIWRFNGCSDVFGVAFSTDTDPAWHCHFVIIHKPSTTPP